VKEEEGMVEEEVVVEVAGRRMTLQL